MKRFMSMNMLVSKVYENSKKVFMGTECQSNWYFCHDALSLMTSNECKNFMIRTGIINHWILLQQRCNKQTVYANRPVGNSPEVMPSDSNLNKDLHEGVNWLCSLTNWLCNSDPKNFSKTTPKQMLSAYARAWDPIHSPDGFPSSNRIVQDIDRVVDEVYLKIIKYWGAIMPHLGMRWGQRNNLKYWICHEAEKWKRIKFSRRNGFFWIQWMHIGKK